MTIGISEMETGHIKWFDNAKGYGFIAREDGQDVFVHYGVIQGEGYRTLSEGQAVKYSVQESDKGPQAAEVIVEPA